MPVTGETMEISDASESTPPPATVTGYFEGERLELTWRYAYRPEFVPLLMDYLGARSEMRILDVGCGTAFLARLLARTPSEVQVIELEADGWQSSQSPHRTFTTSSYSRATMWSRIGGQDLTQTRSAARQITQNGRFKMSRRVKIVLGVGIAVLLLAALLTSTALAQGPTPRTPFGRPWGGFGWGSGGMMGWGRGGMMGGWGGSGMMGGWGSGAGSCPGMGGWSDPGTGTPITIDQAVEAAEQYLADYGNPDLRLTEVMEFTDNFYAEVEEESTGIHAFELLINRYTGAVYPEPGPNMMWNTKYGHMGGMMGGWWGQPSSPMTVTPEQARTYAQQYLDSYRPGTTVDQEADAFYGYYTIHVLEDDGVIGMLSVNRYTGQVWYHTWHGDFIGMQELEE